MKIHSDLLRRLRLDKHWSQEQLSDACGLSVRTIQRVENTGQASLESIKVLAAVFGIEPSALIVHQQDVNKTPIESIKTCFMKYANFSDTASKLEFWWFFLFMLFISALAALIHDRISEIVVLIMLMPFLAASTRRLNDTGRNSWWQLFYIVPFGIFIVLYLLTENSQHSSKQAMPTH